MKIKKREIFVETVKKQPAPEPKPRKPVEQPKSDITVNKNGAVVYDSPELAKNWQRKV